MNRRAKSGLVGDIQRVLIAHALADVRSVTVEIVEGMVKAVVSARPWHDLGQLTEALATVPDAKWVLGDGQRRVVTVYRNFPGQKS